MKKKISYKAKGSVLGNMWGGGSGSYPTKTITADTFGGLISKATEMLNDGSLDSGMGFESLIGGKLHITKTTTIVVDGKEFTNEGYSERFIGTLKASQKLFLSLSNNY